MTTPIVVLPVAELAELVEAAVARALAKAGQGQTEAWVDAKSSPLGSEWTFRRLAKAGAFPTVVVGRKLVAKRSDVEAHMSRQSTKPAAQQEQQGADPMARMLAKGRLRAIGGGKR